MSANPSNDSSKLSASLAELRRRKVFRVGVGYAVGAFAFLQLTSSISGALEIGPATLRLIVLGVLGGFPLALFLAWAYDLTPRGIERTVEPEASRSSRVIELTVIAVLTLAVGSIGYLLYRPGAPPSVVESAHADVADRSIAVLPFVNLSGDAANDYFGDGLAEEILNVLAEIPNLRVAARTSSFAYKGRNEDVRRIGNELNVATVLEGSVRKSGDKVRITVQLINVTDGYHLWSQNFDRTLSDIFTIQDEIAAAVAEALKVRVLGEQGSAAKLGGTINVTAYDLYLLGRHDMQQRTEAGLLASIDYFEKALIADPNYARAWSGKADAYNLLIGYGNLTPGKALPKAEAAAQRALELDPKLAEAHASLGLIRSNQGRSKEAIAEFETAIKLDPDYAPAHVWYGTTLNVLQRKKDALIEYQRAYELDPSLPPAISNLAGAYIDLGRYRDMIPLAERMARLKPEDASSWTQLIGAGLVDLGVPGEALGPLRRALELDPDNIEALTELSRANIRLGDLASAQRWNDLAWARDPIARSAVNARVELAVAKDDAPTAIATVRAASAYSPSAKVDSRNISLLLALYVYFDRPEVVVQLQALGKLIGPYKANAQSFDLGPYIAAALRKAKRETEAKAALDETLRWIDEQVALGATRPDLHYAAAQCYALSGRPTEAGAALTLALQRGWSAAAFARRDPLLLTLRDDATFKALLETVDASIAKQNETLALQQKNAPLPPYQPKPDPAAVALTSAEIDRLVGTYVVGDNNQIVLLRRADDQLIADVGDEPPRRMLPMSALEFRAEHGSGKLTFVLGTDGIATHAVTRLNGAQGRLKRVAFEIPKLGTADKRKYKDYPGVYSFEDGHSVTVELIDGRLMGRQSAPVDDGQLELKPERDDVFFLPGHALRATFVRDAAGKVSALRIQQIDFEVDGARVPPAKPAP